MPSAGMKKPFAPGSKPGMPPAGMKKPVAPGSKTGMPSPAQKEKGPQSEAVISKPEEKKDISKSEGVATIPPAWSKISLLKNEEVYEVVESKKGSFGIAALSVFLMLMTAAIGGAKERITWEISKLAGDATIQKLPKIPGLESSDLIAIVLILIVVVIAFIVLLLVGKSKIALLNTSMRAICSLGGKKNLEIEK
jgi:hypothetical protein